MGKGATKTQGGPPPKPVNAPPAPPERYASLAAVKGRLDHAVGYNMKPYVGGAKKVKKKGRK